MIIFDVVCTVHRIAICIQVDQLDAQILIMCLYLSLSALHVSDPLVHHQERHSGAVYRKLYMLVPYVWLLRATATRMVPAYMCTSCDIQLQNVAPDDGLKSPKHEKHLMINKGTL